MRAGPPAHYAHLGNAFPTATKTTTGPYLWIGNGNGNENGNGNGNATGNEIETGTALSTCDPGVVRVMGMSRAPHHTANQMS
ncbi:hypothetical protein LshimejAT787_1200600 [Lyophyllum shimeji]|uniref:Uncharacterized protein n=1 Tax=Lyophyllum shimeji TaxID=47721 RepID=A0A9P3UTX3_LYOSH|nr:hypothetical protein LshimejAT787_1200600 [Lyophyllum shimeji]